MLLNIKSLYILLSIPIHKFYILNFHQSLISLPIIIIMIMTMILAMAIRRYQMSLSQVIILILLFFKPFIILNIYFMASFVKNFV